jgi:hypothetical protein
MNIWTNSNIFFKHLSQKYKEADDKKTLIVTYNLHLNLEYFMKASYSKKQFMFRYTNSYVIQFFSNLDMDNLSMIIGTPYYGDNVKKIKKVIDHFKVKHVRFHKMSHIKLYMVDNTFYVGSLNLVSTGWHELMVELPKEYNSEMRKVFDDLWESSVDDINEALWGEV